MSNILDLAYLVNARIMQKILIVAQIWLGSHPDVFRRVCPSPPHCCTVCWDQIIVNAPSPPITWFPLVQFPRMPESCRRFSSSPKYGGCVARVLSRCISTCLSITTTLLHSMLRGDYCKIPLQQEISCPNVWCIKFRCKYSTVLLLR